MTMFSRRQLCLKGAPALVATGLGAPTRAQFARIASPQAVVAALDGLATSERLAGAVDGPVRAIALLSDPSLSALLTAVAAGCSLILSAESPFYGKPADPAAATGPFAAMARSAIDALHDSPAFRAKQAFIADHHLTVYRLTPRDDGAPAAEALAARLGWGAYRDRSSRAAIYRPPGLTLAQLIALAHARLGANGGLRFIGDPAMRLSSVLLAPGTAEVVRTTQALRHADALLTGDMREWELVEYVHDSAEAGMPKALVSTGRILSEQPFLERCGLALKQAFPTLRQHHAMRGDPFWRVQA
ncbi:hypothetical protein [Sphingomonas sp.]|uniref:Nif3-like dinuclear metal center hexameric protein n=1 Tax=Sphingomonas sp. TaxID=28214 RepID=UPI003B3A3090